MKRLKRFFNKKFKRYSFVFLTLISCVVILSTHVSAAGYTSNQFIKGVQSFSGVYFRKNVDQVWNIDPNTVTVKFYTTGAGSMLEKTLPLKAQSVNWVRFDSPIIFSERYGENTMSGFYDAFEIKLQFFNFGNLFSNSPIQQSLEDNISYALDFKLLFMGATEQSSLFPNSYTPGEYLKVQLQYNDGTQDVFYDLKYQYQLVSEGNLRYCNYFFYNEIPGYILKKVKYLVIGANQYPTAFSPMIQFGFPANELFKICLYDPLNAPVYAVSYGSGFDSYVQAENNLNSKYVDSSYQNLISSINSLTTVFRNHSNTFLACTEAIENFTSMGFVSDILYILVSCSIFVVIFRLTVNNL